jgi:hypothetical protein
VFALLACIFSAQAKNTEVKAVLVQIQGQVSISRLAENRRSTTIPGITLVGTEGMELERNFEIATGADSLALLRLFDGLIVAVQSNSSVLIEDLFVSDGRTSESRKLGAIVNLFAGHVVWDLDPSKCALGIGGIRTPKGMVCPTGTTSVRVSRADVKVTTVRGETTLVSPQQTKITVMSGYHLAAGAATPVPVTNAGPAATEDVAAAEIIHRLVQARPDE